MLNRACLSASCLPIQSRMGLHLTKAKPSAAPLSSIQGWGFGGPVLDFLFDLSKGSWFMLLLQPCDGVWQEDRVRQAIQLSLNDQRTSWQSTDHLLPDSSASSDEQLLAALAASVEEENIQR